MAQSYTQNDLLRFIYKETSIAEYFEIDHALENDHVLRREYEKLKKAYNALPRVQFYPSQKVLNKVLWYSKNVQLQAHC